MTTEEILHDIEKIKDKQNDDETAHSMEDVLYFSFVEYVASNPEGETVNTLAEKAALVLSTQELNFFRWCA